MTSATEQSRLIRAAIAAGDNNALARAAHTIKGSSAQLGAVGVTVATKELEDSARLMNFELAQEQFEFVTAKMHVARGELHRWLASRRS